MQERFCGKTDRKKEGNSERIFTCGADEIAHKYEWSFENIVITFFSVRIAITITT